MHRVVDMVRPQRPSFSQLPVLELCRSLSLRNNQQRATSSAHHQQQQQQQQVKLLCRINRRSLVMDTRRNNWTWCLLVFLVFLFTGYLPRVSAGSSIKCIEDGKFYRNPDRLPKKIWTNVECAKYFLCVDGEVYEFKCSIGLLFDVLRQICDFKVDNCDVTQEERAPKPLLADSDCAENELGCADGSCQPKEYFCDGSVDCLDGSDEGWCDVEHDPNAIGACDLSQCFLPDCYCSRDGTRIPGGFERNDTPQMIMLTFDDAINQDNWELYNNVLFTDKWKNPNGCPIRSTFYVSHQYTNYQHVQKLWNDGHEISVHSVSHRGPESWWSHNATIEDWFDEMVGQANIINRFGNVRMEEIRGIRVPFLRIGWNRQFLMMKEFGFEYDASMVAPMTDPPLWPYTMDYKLPHKCAGNNQNCPTRSYPGIWELVMNQLEAGSGYTCLMVDSCPANMNGEDIYRMFVHNFNRHYATNRAPFGLYFHTTWFRNPEYLKAFQRFMDDMQKRKDVYFVTAHQAVQWMRDPTPLNEIQQFQPWQCPKKQLDPQEYACNLPNTCRLHSRVLQQDRYLFTCNECPDQYPWVRNEFGLL